MQASSLDMVPILWDSSGSPWQLFAQTFSVLLKALYSLAWCHLNLNLLLSRLFSGPLSMLETKITIPCFNRKNC